MGPSPAACPWPNTRGYTPSPHRSPPFQRAPLTIRRADVAAQPRNSPCAAQKQPRKSPGIEQGTAPAHPAPPPPHPAQVPILQARTTDQHTWAARNSPERQEQGTAPAHPAPPQPHAAQVPILLARTTDQQVCADVAAQRASRKGTPVSEDVLAISDTLATLRQQLHCLQHELSRASPGALGSLWVASNHTGGCMGGKNFWPCSALFPPSRFL